MSDLTIKLTCVFDVFETLMTEVGVVKVSIVSPAAEKFFVCAFFDNVSAFNCQDAVG